MMNVIIVSKHFKAPKKLALNDRRTQLCCAGAGVALFGLVFSLGLLASRTSTGNDQGQLQGDLQRQQVALQEARQSAQREINALAARMGELQAQANRLNALGERLTRMGKLDDGEFDFSEPVGIGGAESSEPVADSALMADMDALEARYSRAGQQLGVLESLLLNRDIERNQVPSRLPVRSGYVSSGYGGRSDPFGGGAQFHKGVDFDSQSGADVLAVAEGVVSYSGSRSGYGNVVEIDHGNGYTTLYAHNSRNLVNEGDLVRVGQRIAKVGSTGRSTGSHVHFEVHLDGRVVNPGKYLTPARG